MHSNCLSLSEERQKIINVVYKNINNNECDLSSNSHSETCGRLIESKDSFLNNSEKKISSIFGKKGSVLYEFLNVSNLEHPDSLDLFNGLFDLKNFNSLLEFINLADYAAKSCPNIKEHVYKSARQYLNSYIKKSSISQSLFIRFLKDKKLIQILRNRKESSRVHIDLDRWISGPDSFHNFCYGVDSFNDEVIRAIEKANALKSYGLDQMSNMVMRESSVKREDNYFGFNRLNMGDASIILAKQHGYDVSNFDGLRVFASPISKVPLKPSSKVRKILSKVEKFEKIGHLPLFDHLIVVYPYGELEKKKGSSSGVKEDCSYLIKNETISPVILGSRSGKCYFVSYWS